MAAQYLDEKVALAAGHNNSPSWARQTVSQDSANKTNTTTTRQLPPTRILTAGILCAAAIFSLSSIARGPSVLEILREAGNWDRGSHDTEGHLELDDGKFDWLSITPSKDFIFYPCFEDYQCARLSVPLNWNSTSQAASERLALAVVKYPAKVPVTDPRYAGPILFNPGGPGGSGIVNVLKNGKHYQTVVDTDKGPNDHNFDSVSDDKFFDIIGFDPRGVGATMPRMACFPDMDAYANWIAQKPSAFMLEASEYAFDQSWARSFAFGAACAQDRNGQPNIISYMNTPQVAEDMLAIVDRHAQWRDKEAERLLSSARHGSTRDDNNRQQAKEKLNYWGFSYGTILGQTFATMHPDRVGRLVLDAVADAADYYALGWSKNLQDTDRILVRWSDYCHESGSSEKCPFYFETAPAGYLPAMIAHSTAKFLEAPHPLPPSDDHGPQVFGYDDMMGLLVQSLYQPFAKTETVMRVLRWDTDEALEKASEWKAQETPSKPSQKCLEAGPWSEQCLIEQGNGFGGTGILCSDGPDQSDVTKEEFHEYMHLLQRQSDVMGTVWSDVRLSCIGWKARPAWKITDTIGAETANPILFVGNSYDPVTPIRNAYKASKLFPGAAVLHQNTEGHSSISSPSIGSGKAIRAYFQHGELPKPDDPPTEPEFRPFLGCVNKVTGCKNRSPEDERLWRALEARALA